MASICRCGNAIHPVRIKLNYSTCVQCSTTEAYGCAPIINHKTSLSVKPFVPNREKAASKLHYHR